MYSALHFALEKHYKRHHSDLKFRSNGCIKVFMVGLVVKVYNARLAPAEAVSCIKGKEGFIKNVTQEVVLHKRGTGVHWH